MRSINTTMMVQAEHAGERLDRVAAGLFTDFSRAELARWIVAGDLKLDGKVCKPKTRVVGGEVLSLSAERTVREAWQRAEPLELDILFEDEHLLIINKPAGLVVHPGAGNPSGTLVNGLLHYNQRHTLLPRAGVVHRLDKDTSGIMVVAGSAEAQLELSRMIQHREMRRRYSGVCEGRMVAGVDVDKPIGRHQQVRTRQAIRDDGKAARTEFRVRERFRAHSLIDARLHSGRTHQIRVHLQSIGYPLVGDGRYGARGRLGQGSSPELVALVRDFPRQALHAWQLSFPHPLSAEEMSFEAPWPGDFMALVEVLRSDAG